MPFQTGALAKTAIREALLKKICFYSDYKWGGQTHHKKKFGKLLICSVSKEKLTGMSRVAENAVKCYRRYEPSKGLVREREISSQDS